MHQVLCSAMAGGALHHRALRISAEVLPVNERRREPGPHLLRSEALPLLLELVCAPPAGDNLQACSEPLLPIDVVYLPLCSIPQHLQSPICNNYWQRAPPDLFDLLACLLAALEAKRGGAS